MMIPIIEVDLNEPGPSLDHPPRHQRGVGEGTWFLCFLAIQIKCRLRLVVDPCQLRYARLHPKRQFVLFDPGLGFGIAHQFVVEFIERPEAIERLAADFGGNAGWVVDKEDGISYGPEADSRMHSGKISRGPQPRGDGLNLLGIARLCNQNDEGGEVLIERSEAIGDPGSHAGTPRDHVPGLDVGDRRFVVDRFGVHAANEAEVIDHLAGPR